MYAMCSIISKNYLAHARTLAQSFLRHHPTGKAFILLTDEGEGQIPAQGEPFEWVYVRDIGLPDADSLRFRYDVVEFNTAVKPFLMEYLFVSRGVDKLVYLDPDILITQRMDELFRLMDRTSIVLTPHILTPMKDDGLRPSETDLLQAGIYNLGFLALTRSAEAMRLLGWWKARLLAYCLMKPESGYHVDQRWMDFVPALFENVHILKSCGYNAAYWNLHERTVASEDGMFLVNGEPLLFYHFSGFTADLSQISRHQTRFSWEQVPGLRPLFLQYARRLAENGHATLSSLGYTYGFFDNQVRIPPFVREVYRKLGEEAKRFGNPFATLDPGGFYQWLFFPQRSPTGLPRLLHEIYETRPDLQRAFPSPTGAQRGEFLKWARPFIPLEYGVEPKLWNPVMDVAMTRPFG
ncbi:glycosyltransferase family protein [Cohnella fermenti]|uniref:Group 1 glycosyl transferase n=1 Tax=Cohnella fermenti TaxID=2565925 RepID=A0A4S4BVB6_9BACL|nr:group 1 glycosyl transferase [Cohnella fermenti]THF79052.1 group 1 glycosyl transferase [Cohnella fermenti]